MVFTAVILSVRCAKDNWKQNIEYFERVDLNCAKFSSKKDVIQNVQAWILPSGEVWRHGDNMPGRHIVIRDNGFILTIDRLDDGDFGIYYCIVNAGPNTTNVIRIGVNVDGPYFGPTFMEEVKHDAMVGGIAAGCTVVLLIIVWLVCAHCTKEPLPPNIQKLPSTSEAMKNGQFSEAIQMTKIGDSVYYNADEVTVENEQATNEAAEDVKYTGTLSSTGSGDYHSIDSIDRNKKLQSVDPNDVYNSYVKSVHM